MQSMRSTILDYLFQTVPEIPLHNIVDKSHHSCDGGHAKVYRALLRKDDGIKTPVALKELDLPMRDAKAIKVRW